MLRALFVEYPNDPGAWLVDNEYLFGSDILVAPLFEESVYQRQVYLPEGQWIDYQTGRSYAGGWHTLQAGKLPVILLVREGAVIPHIALAQHTGEMDWSKLELLVYAKNATQATGRVYLPTDAQSQSLTLKKKGKTWSLAGDPYNGKVKWKIATGAQQ